MLRRNALLTLVGCLPAAGATKKTGRAKRRTLAEKVDEAIAASSALSRSHLGIRVVDLGGTVLYERNAKNWFVPASNTKLFSTALALSRFGPDHRMITRVTAAAGPGIDGILSGDIRLVGGGDPTLSGRTYPYDKDQEWADEPPGIRTLAEQVANRGIKRITGAVIGDDTAYNWEPFPDGWSIDDPLFEYGAPVSALTVQDNAMRLEVRPGAAAGELAEVYLYPDAGQVTLVPLVQTAPAGERTRIRLERPVNTNELRVWGQIGLTAKPYSTLLAVADPALYAAQLMTVALERAGVAVGEPARARHRDGGDETVPAWPEELAVLASRPMREVVQVVNKVSQNLHAELLLREAGRQDRPWGGREEGVTALRDFLEKDIGLAKEDVNFVDGSGLSRLTLLTPEATTKLLVHMANAPVKDDWLASLPVGGEDGTLGKRFRGVAEKGKVRAKTGTLSHVSALGGYLEHPRKGRLAFTILLNNYNTPAAEARKGIDRLVAAFLE